MYQDKFVFSQLSSFLNRSKFNRLAAKYDGDKYVKHLTCWKWKTLNSLKGRYYTGPNGNTIFLPAAGYRWGGNLYRINGNGYYWSSSQGPSQSDYAYLLNVSSKSSLLDEYYRYNGHMIRPVWCGE